MPRFTTISKKIWLRPMRLVRLVHGALIKGIDT
jgi:hypothetical protein